MKEFGNSGRITIRTSVNAVRIDPSIGEHLHYTLVAYGGESVFSLRCEHRVLWSSKNYEGYQQKYELIWPVNKMDVDAAEDIHILSISFLANAKYSLKVERRDSWNNTLEIVRDVDFESPDPLDMFHETLNIFLLSGPHGSGEPPD